MNRQRRPQHPSSRRGRVGGQGRDSSDPADLFELVCVCPEPNPEALMKSGRSALQLAE